MKLGLSNDHDCLFLYPMHYSFTCGVQYVVVSSITLEAFVQSSLNLVRMCIGIISRTSSITSHITLVNQELSPFNYRNYPKLVLSAQ